MEKPEELKEIINLEKIKKENVSFKKAWPG